MIQNSRISHNSRQSSKTAIAPGFTLVELLVVIVIIAVLAGISIPMFMKMRRSAETATCISNLKQVGGAIITYTIDNNNRLPALQPIDPYTGQRGDIWTVGLARAGYLWATPGVGKLPCGTGVWTCPTCDFMSDTYGGYGVAEGSVFAYGDQKIAGASQPGSLRITAIQDPARTWLVGDAAQSPDDVNKGWYGIWENPSGWEGSHCPAERHNGKVNVYMVDGHVESLTMKDIERMQLTRNPILR